MAYVIGIRSPISVADFTELMGASLPDSWRGYLDRLKEADWILISSPVSSREARVGDMREGVSWGIRKLEATEELLRMLKDVEAPLDVF